MRPGNWKKEKENGDISHWNGFPPSAADRPLRASVTRQKPLDHASRDFRRRRRLLPYWLLAGCRQRKPFNSSPQTKKGKNVSGEKEKGEVIGLNKRDAGERSRVSPCKTRAPTGFFLFFSFFLDAGVVIVEAERKDRECPCVSAASYATTGYRRLASRPRPLLWPPSPYCFSFRNFPGEKKEMGNRNGQIQEEDKRRIERKKNPQ